MRFDSGREEKARGVYGTEPVEALLRMASRGTWPFGAPSFSPAAVASVVARARERPNLLIEKRPNAWDAAWWLGDRLSILAQPIPTGGDAWTGFLFVLVSTSDSVVRLVSNLSLMLSIAGSDEEQLVSSLEERIREGKSYHHVLACVPGSR